jgi:hypothetical protein
MEEEHRGIALVILGIISIIAVIGLVLMFTGANKSSGAVFTNVVTTKEGLPCDSPCTIFPSGNDYDTRMMGLRIDLQNRGWIYLGNVKIDGTTRTGYISAQTAGGWNDPTLECWCPTQGNPAFPPTNEYAAIIPGTGSGAAENAGRYPGVPVDQYRDISFPAGGQQAVGQVPSYPYPGSLNK